MTKKDYIRIAGALYDARDKTTTSIEEMMLENDEVEPDEMWRVSVENIADILAEDNPAFDRTRFYTACGYYGDKRK